MSTRTISGIALILGLLTLGFPQHPLSGAAVGTAMGAAATEAVDAVTGIQVRSANSIDVMLVRALPDPSARAVVIRRPLRNGSHNIILVSPATSPADLAKAVATLIQSVRSKGATIKQEMRAHVTAAASKRTPSPDDKRAAEDLRRLTRAQRVSIPGVGDGPRIEIRIAAPRRG